MRGSRRLLACIAALALAACGNSSGLPQPASGTPANPAALTLKAGNVLPPGQSGYFPVAGQAQYTVDGNPADFGPHVDDQRLLYWSFGAKPGALGGKPGTPQTPKSGVEIYRDAYGVPIVYAGNVRDLWYGVGYAVAQDRLFLMDAVRRMGAGTFAELAGCGSVPGDIQERTLTYSDAEYQAMFDRLSQDAKDAVLGYVDGANAWRSQALLTALPAEYALLSTTPTAFTVKDVLAAGVFITRFVAAEGGNEFQNIRMLKLLAQRYGSAQAGKDAFQDLDWLEDPKAAVSVPRSEGTFANQPEPAAGRDAVFSQMADWAMSLPETIWKGPGTGAAANTCTPLGKAKIDAKRAAQARALIRTVGDTLENFRRQLHGGSHAYALAPARTRDHGTLLVSGPQLGYSYPTLLVEYEIHLNGGGYAARGVSVPILPAVGIGYNDDVAWGLTTGYSKTVDSFIETICSTAQIAAGTCKANQYFHQNQWRDMDCRTETFNYRQAVKGVPTGPAAFSTSAQICRTVHGPIVARDDQAGLARSVQYAMFGHEIDTIEGVRQWNRAHSFADFVEGVKQVTWNENAVVATRDGHIAYFHPGLFLRRSPNTDMRLPSPGGGEYDLGAPMPFDELPHVIDPAQGFVANWNNKPAYGWLDGEGLGDTSRPGGPGQRVTTILDLLATRSDWSFDDLEAVDTQVGTTDHRAREYLPVIAAFRNSAAAQLSGVQAAALDLMLGWDRRHYGPGIDLADASAHDGPAATVFGEYVTALRDELFADLKGDIIDPGTPDKDPNNPNPAAGLTIYGRVAGVGSHLFDMSVMDNLTLRVLDPSSSGLALHRDWAQGRTRDQVMLAALNTALMRLASKYNGGAPLVPADLSKCRRVHPRSQICSLTGVIGPGSSVLGGTLPVGDGTLPLTSCVTMPYQDRGSWVHRVGYEKP